MYNVVKVVNTACAQSSFWPKFLPHCMCAITVFIAKCLDIGPVWLQDDKVVACYCVPPAEEQGADTQSYPGGGVTVSL